VTVFEKEKKLGGMLTLGIPAFRLEKDVIEAEIDVLREMGVSFRTGIEVGKDVSLDDLRAQGYEAFYLAIGAQMGRKLGIEGEDAENVISGVDFLRQVNLGNKPQLDGNIVVIGGGNVAIDVARTSSRVGDTAVTMLCLESRLEMPALPEEVAEAEEEGITIQNGWGPVRIVTESGRVSGVEFKKCTRVFDENHKFSPQYDEAEIILVPARYVLLSIGQTVDWGGILSGSAIELNPNRTVKADPITLQTTESDVFAGGDAFSGPAFAIDAIAMGKEGATSIHRHVNQGQSLIIGRDRKEYRMLNKDAVLLEGFDALPRQRPSHIITTERKSFQDTRATFTEEQIRKESERCLGCGVTVIDAFLCVGCGQCTTQCKFDAIHLERRYNGEGVAYEKLKPVVVKQILKRKVNITVKKITKAITQ